MKNFALEKEEFINKKKSENQDLEVRKGFFARLFAKPKKIDIFEEFINDIYKKYKKIEFHEYEDIDAIKQDFSTIINYDCSSDSVVGFSCGYFNDIVEIHKIKIYDKEVYLGKREYEEPYSKYSSRTIHRKLDVFMKSDINKRLQLQTSWTLFKKNADTFEYNFFNNAKDILEYDLKNSKYLKKSLSEEFYFQNFNVSSKSEILELDDFVKQKLLELYKKYNMGFFISLKDNLMRFEIDYTNEGLKNDYDLLYYLEKNFEGLIEIIFELEEINNNIRFNNIPKIYENKKNIIFDLDDTIILNCEDDSEFYREALINAGYTDDYFYAIYKAIDDYGNSINEINPYFDEAKLLDYINESLEQNFSIDVIREIKKVTAEKWIRRVLVSEEVLKYLSSKYNLYVYTNYFQDVQEERLKNIGYIKYFKGVFGADKYGCKQFKKCFENVLKEIKAKPEECIIIGDDKKNDIVVANELKISSILFDYNGSKDEEKIKIEDYIVIKEMDDLIEIL